jgi:hypothetical protein
MIAVVRKPLSRPQTRIFADDTVPFDDDLFASLVADHPFSAPDCYRLRRLIVERDKVNKRVRPVRWRFESGHEDNLVDYHPKIGQFPKR